MNTGTRLAVILVVSVCGWISFPRASTMLETWIESLRSERNLTDAVRSTSYTLSSNQWLEFSIPPQATSIRILTNASVRTTKVPPASLTTPRYGWRYVVDYEMLRGHDRSVDERRYHLRTSVPQTIDPETGLVQVLTWFRESDRLPTRTCTIPLTLDQWTTRPDRLRLKLASWDRELGEVVVRVYICHERDHYQQPFAWGRMSQESRVRMCRASVYPPDLLSPQERANFLRWNWSALSPQGREGIDYQRQRLYQRDGLELMTDRRTNLSPTMACKAQRPRMFRLPAVPGQVVIRAESLDTTTQTSPRPLQLVTRIHDGSPIVATTVPPKPVALPWSRMTSGGLEATWRVELPWELDEVCSFAAEGGLLELIPSETVASEVRWFPDDPEAWGATQGTAMPLDDEGSLVLNPAESTSRSYVVDANRSLDYTVSHVAQHPTPVRIHVWQFMKDESSSLAAVNQHLVHVTGLNSFGHAVMEIDLPVPTTMSVWDQVRAGSVITDVSETGAYYLQLPEQIVALRMTAPSGSCAVALATRPWDLPRTFQIVGESTSGTATESDEGQTWFVVQPNDFEKRIDGNQSVDVCLAQRPPVLNPLLQEGAYDWQDYLPQGTWLGRYVLAPRDPARIIRDDAWSTTYCELALGQPLSIRWHAPTGTTRVASRLVYDGAAPNQGTVRLIIHGKLWKEFEPRTVRGEIELPTWDIASQGATVELVAESSVPLRLYMAAIESDAAVGRFGKLLVHEVTPEGSQFELHKRTPDRETWIIRSFAVEPSETARTREPYTLEAHIEGVPTFPGQPTTSWTLRSRRFVITPSQTWGALLLSGTTQRADDGQRCVISLGADTPPGRYRVTVRRTDRQEFPVLMSLYQLLPSTVDQFELDRVAEIQP